MRRAVVLLIVMTAVAAGCGRGEPRTSPSEVLAAPSATVPTGPSDPAWEAAPVHPAALLLQDLVEPRLLERSTSGLSVQALTDGTRIAFRLARADATSDDVQAPAAFADACAVQLPARAERDLPAPQMGEVGKPVEITYWRASWQAVVDGRPDDIREIHPGAAVGHYPFDAASLAPGSQEQLGMALRYAPARALGGTMAGPRTSPVEDLLAEGPGSLEPAQEQRSSGTGRRSATGWDVVICRPLPEGLTAGARTQVAFAVWQGAKDEVGARKMRTAWIPLAIEEGVR
jgi:hypothetical protein